MSILQDKGWFEEPTLPYIYNKQLKCIRLEYQKVSIEELPKF